MGDSDLSPSDLARLAGVFNAGRAHGDEQDVRIAAWLGARIAAAYGVKVASRWVRLTQTSPSGKAMFRCVRCRRMSAAPDDNCPAGCGEV